MIFSRGISVHRRYKTVLTFIAVGILNGCYGCPPTFPPRECRDFFSQPQVQREQKFRALPVEKQVDIYLCGMNLEPPAMAYAVYIAEGGEKNIPYLLTRLESEWSEIRQARILDIFSVLAIKGHLRGRQDFLSRLKSVVSRMKDEQFKAEAQEYIREVEKNL